MLQVQLLLRGVATWASGQLITRKEKKFTRVQDKNNQVRQLEIYNYFSGDKFLTVFLIEDNYETFSLETKYRWFTVKILLKRIQINGSLPLWDVNYLLNKHCQIPTHVFFIGFPLQLHKVNTSNNKSSVTPKSTIYPGWRWAFLYTHLKELPSKTSRKCLHVSRGSKDHHQVLELYFSCQSRLKEMSILAYCIFTYELKKDALIQDHVSCTHGTQNILRK